MAYYRGPDKGKTVRDNPEEIADHIVNEHGLNGALSVVDEGRMDASRNGDNYALSVWREVKVILRKRAAGIDGNKGS
jgi:hypothetical protein